MRHRYRLFEDEPFLNINVVFFNCIPDAVYIISSKQDFLCFLFCFINCPVLIECVSETNSSVVCCTLCCPVDKLALSIFGCGIKSEATI